MIVPPYLQAVDRQRAIGLDIVIGEAIVETGCVKREQLYRNHHGLCLRRSGVCYQNSKDKSRQQVLCDRCSD
jgi:hypothetical protein